MGFLNIGATVLTTYKANTAPHKRALRELKGSERKLQKEVISNLDKRNKAWERNIATLGKVGVAVAAVGAAYMAARASFNTFAQDAQLKGATIGLKMGDLKKATHGLVSEIDLLRSSAMLMNSDFKHSQEEIQLITQYMLVLRKQGNDMTEVMKEVGKAFTEANVEGLKRFGVTMKGVTGDAQTHTDMLKLARTEVAKLGDQYKIAGDEMRKTGIEIDDATRALKVQAGSIVNDMAPAIVSILKAAAAWGKAAKNVFLYATGIGQVISLREHTVLGGTSNIVTPNVRDRYYKTAGLQFQSFAAAVEESIAGGNLFELGEATVVPRAAKPTGGGGGVLPTGPAPLDRARLDELALLQSTFAAPGAVTGGVGGGIFGAGGVGGAVPGGPLGRMAVGDELQQVTDAELSAAMQGAEAFQIFSSAATASFNAVISGSKSAAEAFREASGAMIAAKASELFAHGVFHSAMFVGSVFLNPASAAAHAKGAAAAFAGAASLGVLARALGFGGSTGQSAASGASAGRGAGFSATGGGGGSTTTVIIGDDFGTDSRRRRQARARAALKRAEAADGSGSTVEFN